MRTTGIAFLRCKQRDVPSLYIGGAFLSLENLSDGTCVALVFARISKIVKNMLAVTVMARRRAPKPCYICYSCVRVYVCMRWACDGVYHKLTQVVGESEWVNNDANLVYP